MSHATGNRLRAPRSMSNTGEEPNVQETAPAATPVAAENGGGQVDWRFREFKRSLSKFNFFRFCSLFIQASTFTIRSEWSRKAWWTWRCSPRTLSSSDTFWTLSLQNAITCFGPVYRLSAAAWRFNSSWLCFWFSRVDTTSTSSATSRKPIRSTIL